MNFFKRRLGGLSSSSHNNTEHSRTESSDSLGGNSFAATSTELSAPKTKRPDREERKLKEWVLRVPQLANFDACVAAADALAAAPISITSEESDDQVKATCSNSSLTRVDKATGLVHSEVLISPNGTLLLVPPGLSHDNLPFSKYFFKEPKDKGGKNQPSKTEMITPKDVTNISAITSETSDLTAANGSVDGEVKNEVSEASASPTKNSEEAEEAGAEAAVNEGKDGSQSVTVENKDGDDDDVVKDGGKTASSTEDEDDAQSVDSTESIFSELLWNSKDDYAAAVFLGHDLSAQGDLALNGFSAKGWSLPAVSYAMRQTQSSLENLADFCHSVILSRKESAVRTHQACDTLRSQLPMLGGHNPSGTGFSSRGDSDDWELVFDPKSDFAATNRRCGPLLGTPNSGLNRSLVLLEEYFSSSAEAESTTWRHATADSNAILPQLQQAVEDFNKRMTAREEALAESSKRAKLLEERLNKLKQDRDKKWEYVYKAEEKVTRRMEALRKERARQREKARMTKMQQQAGGVGATGEKTGGNEQMWDVVAAISDGMDSTSFEPMDLTRGNSEESEDSSLPNVTALMANTGSSRALDTGNSPLTISREAMEEEMRLPELRATAMAAEEAIEECASYLLVLLGNLDMTRQSARVAAETSMLAAANAQASTLKEMVKLERMALQERLQHLTELEAMINHQEIDVREDLKSYIAADKKDAGGQSHMGDDDDGGIAAALRVLANHVDAENNGPLSDIGMYSDEDDDDDDDANSSVGISTLVSRDSIENAVNALFSVDGGDTEENEESSESSKELREAVKLLTTIAGETSKAAKRLRGTICYALNSKRSGNAEIQSKFHFDNLVTVFDAVLTNCDHDEEVRSLSHAKMLMMLAQTFYLQLPSLEEEKSNVDEIDDELKKQLSDRGLYSGESTIDVAKGDLRIKLGLDGYASLAMASGVIAEGSFTCTPTGVVGFVWEHALKYEDDEWKVMDPVTLLNTFSILDDTIEPVKEDETPSSLWGADKSDPQEALSGNGFQMTSVVLTNTEGLPPTAKEQVVMATSPSRKGRNRRLYIKSSLTDHRIWSKDDYWDEALKVQISESLTQSGVMSNFERVTMRGRRTGGNEHEYKKFHKTKWHDLSLEERVGAASQVHAVVFAQLGALAHSMIEFGCGLQRSCAFVRRMSIQHQLPSAQRTMLLQHLIARFNDEKAKQPLA